MIRVTEYVWTTFRFGLLTESTGCPFVYRNEFGFLVFVLKSNRYRTSATPSPVLSMFR